MHVPLSEDSIPVLLSHLLLMLPRTCDADVVLVGIDIHAKVVDVEDEVEMKLADGVAYAKQH